MEPLPDISQLKDQIWEEVRKAMKFSNHTEGFWDNVQAFVHAVDWKVCCAGGAAPSSVSMQL